MPKGIMALLGKPGEGGAEASEDKMAIKEQAMSDLFAAFEAKDPKAGAEAFKRAYDACAAEHGSEEY